MLDKFKVSIQVEDDAAIIEFIDAYTWKSALVMHSILMKTAILELSATWLMSYDDTVLYYDQFDVKISVAFAR